MEIIAQTYTSFLEVDFSIQPPSAYLDPRLLDFQGFPTPFYLDPRLSGTVKYTTANILSSQNICTYIHTLLSRNLSMPQIKATLFKPVKIS